jgi:hypothetical protein
VWHEAIYGASPARYCAPCANYVPMRARHCYKCGTCLSRRDHHCIWINNCVGLRNHKAFILMMVYMGVGGIYAWIMFIIRFIEPFLRVRH